MTLVARVTAPVVRVLASLLVIAAAAPDVRAITSCAFTSVVPVHFGAYDPFASAPVDTTGGLQYRCQGVGAADTVMIELSAGNGGSVAAREMTDGAAALHYNVYLDAPRSIVWGDGNDGSSRYGPVLPPEDSDVSVPVYGRVPAGQNVPAGQFGDTLVVTILF